ncbi:MULTISPECIES: TetR/AcrR family transcriptional regulator [unclassified Streptomyces]|uniref:TetR/AcrR family transcriptional regulator n=1 Tax=unclassified Streptomyces TaxID=2593676 RepID=UPI002E149FB8|nr:TetR/AcrR family transcriptional regulator [Streptomyces sp. NBC_01240]WSU21862.1 TetR/AcrR family transcriptional regulator [Streptomyces sp. NBC_01108]
MPTARDALLDAALTALATLPWPAVRMVDVAAIAGVSRQTLYNEFGSKDGLARALVRSAADGYLTGVERALGSPGGTGDRLAATAAWTVRAVRTNALVRGLLTGCWSDRLPRPVRPAMPTASRVPAQRRADSGTPTPAELLGEVQGRAVVALDEGRPPPDIEALAATCGIALRLALSYALVPALPGTDAGAGPEGDPAPLVRELVERLLAG